LKANALWLGLTCSVLVVSVAAASSDKEKDAAQAVDSGAFTILVKGQPVATESFSVQQRSSGSTIKSEIKDSAGTAQNSELQLTGTGELVRYEWHELNPGKSQLVLVPNDQFLKETTTNNPGDKPAEAPFLLPASTAVLDNNFFIHREVLAWRYLAANCKPLAGKMQCATTPADFGAIVPQDHSSMRVVLELKGKETVPVHGTQRELMRVNLKSDTGDWTMWLDDADHFKLVRILIAADSTEVLRD
jgi:hypothetical protein